MRTDLASVVRLEDYRPPRYRIPTVELDVRLDGPETLVTATLSLEPASRDDAGAELVLDGDELNLVSASLNGKPLDGDAYAATAERFVLAKPPKKAFTLTLVTKLDPAANTKLMGLYRSSGNYCTQCEAEGFRRITYFLDRPDVLSVYTTRIEADRDEAPVLLGNGNLVEAGEVEGTSRHYAVWHDPHPKPSYLFALVGGKLASIHEPFTTASGRKVDLGIYVEPGKEERAAYAMDSLRRCMIWDETVFGREYDLDVFNVVAVSDFNMGAMENKGLNIFNDKYVLADPETATDADYANIEAIIAHEYFHNWTGNRITCRDWFQLCLKEGLTVFRDQEFSSDERSRPVKRIADVRNLRAAQFAEDSGPLAHPVRPSQYKEINNFYTPTIYEKGAEVIRMLKVLIGDDAFRRGMDLYFERCDGTAATVEDFIGCFAEVSGQNLDRFFTWYEQAGTPTVLAASHYDAAARTFRIDVAQKTPPTPGQAKKKPVVVPIRIAFFDEDGRRMELEPLEKNRLRGELLVLDKAAMTVSFADVERRPIPSVLRGFSAPVRLEHPVSDGDLALLFAHDDDAFNRWQAAQTLATRIMLRTVAGEDDEAGATLLADAYRTFLSGDGPQDPAFAAQALALPSEGDLIRELGSDVDPDRVHAARLGLRRRLGRALSERLTHLRNVLASREAYSPDAASAGRRALRNAALDLIAVGEPSVGEGLAAAQLQSANNMTDRMAALAALAQIPGPCREASFDAFAERYRDEPLVLDKWFGLQATIAEPETLDRVRRLMRHPRFSMQNPNRVRALIGMFAAGNPTQFNRADGAGYAFVAEQAATLDGTNPQVAARLLGAFKMWRTLEPARREKAEAALRSVQARPGLSRDLSDIAERCLA